MRKFVLTLLALFILSCAGSKVEIKPEQQVSNAPIDTTLTLNEPKKLFSTQITDSIIDSVVIPGRRKQEKTTQIIVTPIILPITTFPIQAQPTEQKFDTKPAPEVKSPPEQLKETPIEVKEKEPETELVKPEIKSPPQIKPSEYFIQIGAFVTQNSANEQLKKFKTLYPDKNAMVVFDSIVGLYKVQINGTKDSTDLTQTLALIQEQFPDAFITSTPTSTKSKSSTEQQTLSSKPQIKVQIGAYSKISNAQKIKEYIESKFKVTAEISEEKGFFKVFVYLNEDAIDTLNEIKSEFTSAFIVKQ
ncbi:MAG: SPOR domain-containing protein [Candidatus Kryptonium sp.]